MSVTRSVCAECVQSAAFGGDRMMCRSAVAVSLTSPRTLLVAMLLSSSAVVSAQDQVSQSSADQMAAAEDRTSVVEGKSVSVRVDLGGRRIIKKKTDARVN